MTARISSEGELIETYLAPLARRTPGALGLQDDCAVLVVPPESDLIVTTDAVAACVHFFENDGAADIAWKALAVNVSDLAAKGAEPFAYQMALSFPDAPDGDWMRDFAAGLEVAQSAFGLGLLGGDTDRRPGPLTITITAFGHIPKGRMVLRSGAQPGDLIFVSGSLGDSALGLKLRLDPELAASSQLNTSAREHLANRYLRPTPRLKLGLALLDYASAAMDISDGLMKDLGRMCQASRVGAQIEYCQLPISAAAEAMLKLSPGLLASIVAGGDDYEILCTVPPGSAEAFVRGAHTAGVPVTSIGTVSAGCRIVLTGASGVPIKLENMGWDHF